VFGTNESNLALDFSKYVGATFNTGWDCTFNTGYNCTFKTGYNCTFKTGDNCTFEVEEKCSLTYCWNNCFEVYKLVPGKIVKLLENGKLQDVVPVKPKQKDTLELTEEQLEKVKAMLGI